MLSEKVVKRMAKRLSESVIKTRLGLMAEGASHVDNFCAVRHSASIRSGTSVNIYLIPGRNLVFTYSIASPVVFLSRAFRSEREDLVEWIEKVITDFCQIDDSLSLISGRIKMIDGSGGAIFENDFKRFGLQYRNNRGMWLLVRDANGFVEDSASPPPAWGGGMDDRVGGMNGMKYIILPQETLERLRPAGAPIGAPIHDSAREPWPPTPNAMPMR